MKWALLLLFAWLPAFAMAADTTPTYKMTVSGTLEIGPDGVVRSYELKPQPKPAIAALVKNAVDRWRFAPILDAGKPVIARTQMDLHLNAVPLGDVYSVKVAQVTFGKPNLATRVPLPLYPSAAARGRLNARVLLALKINANGKVVSADVVQTSLGASIRDEHVAVAWRHLFEKASLDAVYKWTYDPTEVIDGKSIGSSAYQPIAFDMVGSEYQWDALVPGPIHPIAWLVPYKPTPVDVSQLKNGEAVALDSRFKLQNDVIGKTL